ncbi:MAG: hypothetical protein BWY28_03022 [bacterium ADurb.Bin236]|nr:MAG: hypothetical protein BWY28_03022 [bacterium ADurb.Bin236]
MYSVPGFTAVAYVFTVPLMSRYVAKSINALFVRSISGHHGIKPLIIGLRTANAASQRLTSSTPGMMSIVSAPPNANPSIQHNN